MTVCQTCTNLTTPIFIDKVSWNTVQAFKGLLYFLAFRAFGRITWSARMCIVIWVKIVSRKTFLAQTPISFDVIWTEHAVCGTDKEFIFRIVGIESIPSQGLETLGTSPFLNTSQTAVAAGFSLAWSWIEKGAYKKRILVEKCILEFWTCGIRNDTFPSDTDALSTAMVNTRLYRTEGTDVIRTSVCELVLWKSKGSLSLSAMVANDSSNGYSDIACLANLNAIWLNTKIRKRGSQGWVYRLQD